MSAYVMRISDWSSDVCSSDLSDCRRFVAVSGSTRLAGRRADQERRMSAPGKSDRWVRRRPPARDLRDLLLDLLTRLVCVRHHNIDPRVTRRLWRLPADAGRKCLSANSRSEEHTSELQSLMRISYAVFCLQKKKHTN